MSVIEGYFSENGANTVHEDEEIAAYKVNTERYTARHSNL